MQVAKVVDEILADQGISFGAHVYISVIFCLCHVFVPNQYAWLL